MGEDRPPDEDDPKDAPRPDAEASGAVLADEDPAPESEAAQAYHQRARLAEDRLAEVLGAYRKLKIDNEGHRERITRNLERRYEQRRGRLLLKFIDILDNLDRALEAAGLSYAGEPLLEGMILVRTQLLQTLQDEGLERIPVLGMPFDPHLSESVGTQVVTDPDHDHVVMKEHMRGYRLHGRIARVSTVTIGVYTPIAQTAVEAKPETPAGIEEQVEVNAGAADSPAGAEDLEDPVLEAAPPEAGIGAPGLEAPPFDPPPFDAPPFDPPPFEVAASDAPALDLGALDVAALDLPAPEALLGAAPGLEALVTHEDEPLVPDTEVPELARIELHSDVTTRDEPPPVEPTAVDAGESAATRVAAARRGPRAPRIPSEPELTEEMPAVSLDELPPSPPLPEREPPSVEPTEVSPFLMDIGGEPDLELEVTDEDLVPMPAPVRPAPLPRQRSLSIIAPAALREPVLEPLLELIPDDNPGELSLEEIIARAEAQELQYREASEREASERSADDPTDDE